jgi:hypothetical protein
VRARTPNVAFRRARRPKSCDPRRDT